MRPILLINPNTSAATTALMLAVAAPLLPPGTVLRGATAELGAAMILDEAALEPAAAEVVRIGAAAGVEEACIVAAFADPGADRLRGLRRGPVVGIGAAAIGEAGFGGRRFGIATTTPGLRRAIEAAVAALELEANFTGLRLAAGDPLHLATHPALQDEALAVAAAACIEQDGAEAVVIGGGPLSASAARLRGRFAVPVIEPVPAAIRAVLSL